MRDIPSCKWLDQWTELAQKYEPPALDFYFSRMSLQNLNVRSANVCVLKLQVRIPVQPVSAAQSPGGVRMHQ